MVFRKLFGRGPGDDGGTRELNDARDLAAGDLLTFKHRLQLPPTLQGQTFEVASVGTYQYDDGMYLDLTLVGEDRSKVHMGIDPDDPNAGFDLSITVPRGDVLKLFDEDTFAELWDDEAGTELNVVDTLPQYDGWLAPRYTQVVSSGVGFYFERDCRGETLSSRRDDDSEEFRYHECEADDDQYTLTVEVWGDGETDVSLDVSCPGDVIETMWPGD